MSIQKFIGEKIKKKEERGRKSSRDVDSESLPSRQQKGRKISRDGEDGKKTEAGRLSEKAESQKEKETLKQRQI